MPWQVDFALRFLKSKDKRYWELVGPPGVGKGRLATALIAHELESGLNKRVLVLAPTQTLRQHQHELLSYLPPIPITPLIVDRKAYLELESSAPIDRSPWPLPSVILMSIDVAKREDIATKLSSVSWDFVVIDESHRLTGMRKALFDRLKKSRAIHRALLLASADHRFLKDVTEIVKIDYKDVVDWNGQPIFGSLEEKVTQVFYQRTEEERAFLRELQGFARQLADKWSYGKLQGEAILQAASSSIFATEAMLLRLLDAWRPLRNKIAHQVPWDDEDLRRVQRQLSMDGIDEPDVIDELTRAARKPLGITIQPEEFLIFYRKLELLLDQIEKITTDPKLDALISHITKFRKDKDNPYLCMVSSFARTVEYVNSSVQGIGIPAYSLLSYMENVELRDSVEAFREKGGFLIATDASLEGMGLEFVDACINYDLPANPQVLEQRLGRFVRFGRKGKFRMVVFRDRSDALSWEEDLFKRLEDKVSFISRALSDRQRSQRKKS